METAGRERREIELLLEDSPSLRGEVAAIAAAVWPRTSSSVASSRRARRDEAESRVAVDRTGYTVEQLLGDWLPDRASSVLVTEGASRGSP